MRDSNRNKQEHTIHQDRGGRPGMPRGIRSSRPTSQGREPWGKFMPGRAHDAWNSRAMSAPGDLRLTCHATAHRNCYAAAILIGDQFQWDGQRETGGISIGSGLGTKSISGAVETRGSRAIGISRNPPIFTSGHPGRGHPTSLKD